MEKDREEKIIKLLFEKGIAKSDLKKNEIIKVVIHLIATKGIEHTSFENIGRELNMTKANVAYYFQNKDSMIEYAIKYITLTAQSITVSEISLSSNPEQSIKAYVKGAFEWAHQFPEQITVMFLLFYYSSFLTNYSDMYSDIRTVGKSRLAELLRAHCPKLNAVNARSTADLIQSIITGKLIDYYTTKKDDNLSVIEAETTKQILKILG